MSENSISTSGGALQLQQSSVCVMCEFVMTQVDNFLEDNTTKVGVWWSYLGALEGRKEKRESIVCCLLFILSSRVIGVRLSVGCEGRVWWANSISGALDEELCITCHRFNIPECFLCQQFLHIFM